MVKRLLVRRKRIIIVVILVLLVFFWQLPKIIKAIPSRYVAAYLPEPVQAFAERNHVEILPTAVSPVNTQKLLSDQPLNPYESSPGNASPLATELSEDWPLEQSSSSLDNSTTPMVNNDTSPEQGSPTGNQVVSTPNLPEPTRTPVPTAVPIPESTRLQEFRHHFQTWNNCGPATLAMGLSYFDVFLSQSQTASVLKPDPEDRNVSPFEMANYVNQNSDLSALSRANGSLRMILRLLSEGFPVVVELGLDPPGEYRWMDWYGHYLLLVAYDDAAQKVWVYDSWFGTSDVPGENADPDGREVSYSDLDRYWRQFNRSYIVLYKPEDQSTIEEIIGHGIVDTQMWQDSLDQARKELEKDPEDAYLWFNLGTSYKALGQFEMAAAAFDQARNIGLPWRMLWYQFGPYEAYYQVGRYDDVILLADVTLQDRPYFEESYYYKGLALEAKGDFNEARFNYEKASRFNPGYIEAQIALKSLDG